MNILHLPLPSIKIFGTAVWTLNFIDLDFSKVNSDIWLNIHVNGLLQFYLSINHFCHANRHVNELTN